MNTTWLSVLALLVSGCVMDVAPEPGQEETNNSEQQAPALHFDRVRQEAAPPDLCVTGEKKLVNGTVIVVPVPCAHQTIDRGDPAPDFGQKTSELEEKSNPGNMP